jgi:hypothetical protein
VDRSSIHPQDTTRGVSESEASLEPVAAGMRLVCKTIEETRIDRQRTLAISKNLPFVFSIGIKFLPLQFSFRFSDGYIKILS